MDEIEAEIILIKDNLEFCKEIEDTIEANATGYELLFKIEKYQTKAKNKARNFYAQIKYSFNTHIYLIKLLKIGILHRKFDNSELTIFFTKYFGGFASLKKKLRL